MTTRLSKRLLLAALFLFLAPLSALAQIVDATPNTPVTVVAGGSTTAGVGYTNDTGADQTDVVISFGALPTGVTWNEGSCIGSGFDVTNINTTGEVTIASVLVDTTVALICDLDVAASVADGEVFQVVATTQGVGDPSSEITVAREFDLGLAVVDAPDPVLAGSGAGNLTHTFTLSRAGLSDAAGVTVELVPTLPAGVALDSAVPTVGSVTGTTWTVGDWAASENGVDQTLTLTLTVDATAAACTDCVSAEGTVSAASGTDTDATNDTAVDPTSIETAADLTTSFATSIMFSNGAMGTVTATLTCNAGLPLSQSFDISEGSPVTFTMTDLPFLTDGTECEITATGVDGYTVTGSANGGAAAASCMFDSTTFDTTGANTCEFTATPNATAVTVETIVMSDDPTIGDSFTTTISCDSVNPNPDDAFDAVTVTDSTGLFEADWYADPDGGTTCTVSTVFADSAIEAEPCEFSFDVGDEAAGCDVTGTVFFEGIPTLSQYGLALMALLMLGVGFVGMRRFV